MQKGSKAVTIVIAVALVLAGAGVAAFVFMNNKSAAPKASQQVETDDSTIPTTEAPKQDKMSQEVGATITYTDNGFEPSTYTVKAGTVVKVENKSTAGLQFSSDSHPTHTKEPELNTATIGPNESTTFTPTKVGTWTFHNHLNAADTGTLIVE